MKASRKRIVLFMVLFLFVWLIAPRNILAQELESSLSESKRSVLSTIKNFLKKFDFTTRISEEFDSNIFLTEDNEDSDFKTTIYQGASLKLVNDPVYFQFDYAANLDYYHQEGDHIFSQNVGSVLSYRPFKKLSLGISSDFRKTNKSNISTSLGDRIISLGYRQNTSGFQAKYDLTDVTYLDFNYGFYRLDVADSGNDDFIDRINSDINLALKHEFSPTISSYVGYGYQRVRFQQTELKNSQSDRLFLGLTKKFPEYFKLTTEVGYEYKDIDAQGQDQNVDFRILANTLFSTFTKASFYVAINGLQISSRSEYSQYTRSNCGITLEHSLTPKHIISSNLNYELQRFEEGDSISSSFDNNRYTKIYSANLNFKEILNELLTMDAGYTFTKRDTDFAGEGYSDHKVTIGFTSTF